MSVKMQVMLTTPRAFGLRNIIRSSIRCKVTKAALMKRLHGENKALFGELVETRKEKTTREKLEKKHASLMKTAIDLPPQKDTEAYHISGVEKRPLSRVKFIGKFLPYSTKKIIRIPDTKKSSKEINNLETIPTVENSHPLPDGQNPQSDTRTNTSDGKGRTELTLPPDILINRMTTFSYLDSEKNTQEILESTKPVSISPYSDRSKLSIPSVTKILNKTMSAESKLNLELWKQRMILQLGLEGFEKYSQELLLNGKQFHSSIQNYLIHEPFEVPSAVENSWQSVQHVLKEISATQVIESHVVHSKLFYRGVVDCVAVYRGKLCVIDWKKSDKPKDSIENTFDAPVQVASYIGALNSDSNYNFQVQNGLVVVGYTNGAPASVHEISPTLMNKYWILWLRRLQQYYLDLKLAKFELIVKNEDRRKPKGLVV